MESRTITVEATGTCDVSPDVVTVTATAVATGTTASTARSTVHSRGETIRAAVGERISASITTVDLRVQSGAVTFAPEMDAECRAVEEFQLRCEPASVADVVVEITDSGGTIQAVEYQLTDTSRAGAEDEAREAAIDRAHEKATTIAAETGVAVGEPQAATTKRVATGQEAGADDAWGSSDSLHPAPIAVAEAVEVSYALIEQ